MTRPGASPPSLLGRWLIWTVGFLAFPVAGLAGTAAAGRVDTVNRAPDNDVTRGNSGGG